MISRSTHTERRPAGAPGWFRGSAPGANGGVSRGCSPGAVAFLIRGGDGNGVEGLGRHVVMACTGRASSSGGRTGRTAERTSATRITLRLDFVCSFSCCASARSLLDSTVAAAPCASLAGCVN